MDQYAERASSHQIYRQEEAPPDISDDVFHNLIVQHIDAFIANTEIDASAKLLLISHYVTVKYTDFLRTGQIEAIEEAIQKQRQALNIADQKDKDCGEELDRLGVLLGVKYDRLGFVADLQEAFQKAEDAVRVTPRDHPDLAGRLNNLGNQLQRRYERTGNLADLEMAIKKAEEAVQVTSPDHPELAGLLTNLGNLLLRRYKRTGNMADLEMAIKKQEEAVRLTPLDHPDLAGTLNNLGNQLQRRYERTGNMADLELAIRKQEEAVRLTPLDHPNLAGILNNLGNQLQRRYERTGNIADLKIAIEKVEEAVQVTPPDHPNLATSLNSLGNMLQRWYEWTGNINDLEMAIKRVKEAIQVTPRDHPDLAGRLNNLGNQFHSRYQGTGNIADLEMAIEKAEEAVRLTPLDHPDLAVWLTNLGRDQLFHPGPMSTTNALASFSRSWNCRVGIPSVRLWAAVEAADILIDQKRWDEAADLTVEAISLLPLMNQRTLSRDDQQHSLTMFSGLAAKACSVSLQSGRPVETSIEILEQGRGAILGLLIDDRRDISPLHQSYPEQAAEYERLRMEVNADLGDFNTIAAREQMQKRRVKAVQELEQCIERIRRLPGYTRFLMSASAADIRRQAAAGPIVVVNVTDIRSDAIIVTPDHIQLLPLPSFSADILRSWTSQHLTEFSGSDFGKKNKKYCTFLSWLWDACVQPIVVILCSVNKTGDADQRPLRTWWIGTGEAAAVPFHAAGCHSPGSGDNVISHMVCSYTPTIKALEFSRERLGKRQRPSTKTTGTLAESGPSLCVATMPRTPGMTELPRVEDELSSVLAAASSTFTIIHLPTPTAADIEAQLSTCQVFHFAGHGIANAVDPSRGSLLFQTCDGPDPKPRTDMLSINDIARLYLPYAQLAYLSACSTAENQATELADEVIHLVSGFQVAGFPHVVGSMWQSEDEICADMARLFYQTVCTADQGVLGDGSVARALHTATLEIRQRWWRQPLLWAQYVHFGG